MTELTHEELGKKKAKNTLLNVGIVSIVMLFAGLTSAYVIAHGGNYWLNVALPFEFWISSITVLLVSISMILALQAAKKGNSTNVKIGVLAAFLLGGYFCISQYQAAKNMVNKGQVVAGSNVFDEGTGQINISGEYGKDYTITYKGRKLTERNGIYYDNGKKLGEKELVKMKSSFKNTSVTFIYVLAIAHLIHVLAGLINLIVVLIKALKNRYNSENYQGIELCGKYWHFLGILWFYLLGFLHLYL